MTEAEKKAKFINMRSEGQSYTKIAAALDISKSTCSRWSKELKAETDKREAETLEELYKAYGATREARLKAIGETLQRIEKALAEKDYNEISLDRLLSLKLKYIEMLKGEYHPITEGAKLPETLNAQGLLDVLKDLLERVRKGELTEKQAEQETKILTAIIKAMQGVEEADKQDPNITIIVKPATQADFEEEIEKDRNGITFIEDLEPDE